MSIKKNKYSVSVAIKGSEKIYLSRNDEEMGVDIVLNIQGWQIIAL